MKGRTKIVATPSSHDAYQPIRNLALRLHISTGEKAPRIVTFIAARAGEGTSTLAYQYAALLAAETDKKILLIDASPTASPIYTNGKRQTGIVDTLLENKPLENALDATAPNLHCARWVGKLQNRAASDNLAQDAEFWTNLINSFGYIIIDAPAIQHSIEGMLFAIKADAAVMVVEAEATPIAVSQHLRDNLIQAGANVAGVVLNKRQFYIPEKMYSRI